MYKPSDNKDNKKEDQGKRRTYKLLPKHIKLIKLMKLIDDDKNYQEIVRECIELGWKHKYRDLYEKMEDIDL